MRLQFLEGQFDRIEVKAVGRQKDEPCNALLVDRPGGIAESGRTRSHASVVRPRTGSVASSSTRLWICSADRSLAIPAYANFCARARATNAIRSNVSLAGNVTLLSRRAWTIAATISPPRSVEVDISTAMSKSACRSATIKGRMPSQASAWARCSRSVGSRSA